MKRVLIVLALLSLAGCAQTSDLERVNSSYMQAWKNRLADYKRQFIAADTELRADADSLTGDIQAQKIRSWQELVPPVAGISDKVREAYTIAGRGETLSRYITHMQADTTPGLTEVWFQNEYADWQQRAERVDRQTRDFLATIDSKIAQSSQWMDESEALAREQGFVRGTAMELPSLYQQAAADYGEAQAVVHAEQVAESERRQRVAQALANMNAYYNQQRYQQELLNTLNRPRTCSFFFNSMTCR